MTENNGQTKYPYGKHPNSLKNLKPRKKGDPALNPHGRPPKDKSVTEAMRRLLERGIVKDKAYPDALAENLLKRALRSSYDLNVVLDRTEGKVTDKLEATVKGDVRFIIGRGYEDRPDLQPDKQGTE